MNVLFVCTANKLRCPMAQAVFTGRPDIAGRSAGLDPEAPCQPDEGLVACPCLINEEQSLGIKVKLAIEPGPTLLHDVVAVLLDRVASPFACNEVAHEEAMQRR